MKLTGSSPLDDPTMVTGLPYLSFSPRSVSEELSTEKDKTEINQGAWMKDGLAGTIALDVSLTQDNPSASEILEKESKEWPAISIEFLWTAEKV